MSQENSKETQNSQQSKSSPRETLFTVANEVNNLLNKSWIESVKSGKKIEDIMGDMAGSAAKSEKTIVPRLAFTEDPFARDNYMGLYKNKKRLIPDWTIKRIRVEDHLIAAILRARGNSISMFGRTRKNRFDIGLDVEIKPEFQESINEEEMAIIQSRIGKFTNVLVNCGKIEGVAIEDRMLFSEWLYTQAINGLSFGRHATEIIYDEDGNFHRFRPVDTGTIYRAVKRDEDHAMESLRRGSIKLLEQIAGCTIDPQKAMDGQYSWIQVVEGTPRQAFTSAEMLVGDLYPSTDIEHNGYPLTPIDTIMQSITTHISIDAYNKLYFQNGRAAKGMLVLKSEQADTKTIERVKQDFTASINNVNNSFRTPIFGVGREDDVMWVPMNGQKKDGEFQFLYDAVARNILSAFGMSPDELPGYGHLSRGTNQQALSEANNEYKLIAARDIGIRPLILKMQDFINEQLFPIIDEELAQLCYVQLSGLDADTRQDEALRLQQDAPIHYNMNEVMEHVDKEPVGRHLAGEMLFNEVYQIIVDKSITVGQYIGHKVDPAYIVDPMLKYRRDAFWFQNMDTLSNLNPHAVQAYMARRPDAIELLKMLEEDMLDELDDG